MSSALQTTRYKSFDVAFQLSAGREWGNGSGRSGLSELQITANWPPRTLWWETLTSLLNDRQLDRQTPLPSARVGHRNWTFFGSHESGETAAGVANVILPASGCGIEPFAWLRHVLWRVCRQTPATLNELLRHS